MISLQLIKFAIYRLKILSRSYQNLLVLFVLPPLLILIMGQVMQEAVDPSEVPVAVVDEDDSNYSRIITHRLAENPTLRVQEMEKTLARQEVISGNKEVAFILKSGFTEKINEGEVDNLLTVLNSPSSLLTEMLNEIAAGEITRLTSNVVSANLVVENYRYYDIPYNEKEINALWQKAWDFSDKQWEPTPLVQLESHYVRAEGLSETIPPDYRAEARNLIFMISIFAVAMMFLSIFLHGWIVQERANGIRTRIKSSAAGLSLYTAGNSLAVLGALLLSSLLALGLGTLFLPVATPFSPQLLVVIFFYLLSCAGISLFLASIAQTSAQMQLLGIMVTLFTSAFGVIFFHLEDTSIYLDFIIKLAPQSWLIHGTREFLFYQQNWAALTQPLMALTALTLVFLSLGQKVGKKYD